MHWWIIEVFTGVLVVTMLIAMAVALYVGLRGALGLIHFVRCDRCGHLGMTTASATLRACGRCRHGRLLHPLLSLHRAHVGQFREGRAIPTVGRTSGISRPSARPSAQQHESTRGSLWR
jgi:hypothetical protein